MSNFIELSDYLFKIRENRLEEVIDDNEAIVNDAEQEAIATIDDALHKDYDTDAIFLATGDDRSKTVLKWAKHIVLYNIFERVPDNLVPERIVKNYDDTMKTLDEIAKGNRSVKLPRKLDEEGDKKTHFRSGGATARPQGY